MQRSYSINFKCLATVTHSDLRAASQHFFSAIRFLALAILTGTVYADATCTINSNGVNFGTYDVFSLADNETVGDIGVSCTGLTESSTASYDIQISAGEGSFTSRLMTSGSSHLNYNLYINSSYSIVWGDNSGSTAVISDSYSLGLDTVTNHYPVYGLIPARQNVDVGNYNDTLIVTVNY